MSKWIQHVKSYAAEHGISYKEALKLAAATYKQVSGPAATSTEEPGHRHTP